MKKKGERSREREVDERPGNEGKVETRKWQQQRRLAAAGEAAAKPSGGSALRNQMTAAPKRLADRPAATEFEPPPAHPPSLLLSYLPSFSRRTRMCRDNSTVFNQRP